MACKVWAQRHPGVPRPVGPQQYKCEQCGGTFTRDKLHSGKRPRFCGDQCWERYRHLNRGDGYWRDRDVIAVRRAALNWNRRNRDRARAARLARWPRELERSKEYHKRRRAQKFAVVVEKFTSLEIYERDGWICQICGVSVDPALKSPDGASASLDHIVPLAKGGAHTRANTQLAHLTCNVRKSDRI